MTTIRKIFNKTDRDNNPLLYTFYCTSLENVTNQIMTIDSCSNITLLTPSNNFVTINSRLGIGIDPSSAYSFHVLGNTFISGNIISNNVSTLEMNTRDFKIDISSIKTDISGLKIGISGLKTDISASENKIADLSLNLFNLSIRYNEISLNYYNLTNSFNDLSRSHYNLKSNVISLSNELYLRFDSINYSAKTGFYGKIFVYNQPYIDISYRFYWYIEPQARVKQTNWFSISGQPIAYEIGELYRLDSLNTYLYLHTKASNNNIFNTLDKPYVTTFNNRIVDICHVFLNNNSEHKMTLDLSNMDNVNNGEIIIKYNISYVVAPSAPTNVVASDPSNGEVTLNWTAPYSGGAAIIDYNVTSDPVTTSKIVYSTSTIFQGLTNGTSYTFYVIARNSRGNSLAGSSNPIIPSTLPSAPTNVVASVLINGNVSLSWTAPDNGGATIVDYTAYYIASNLSFIGLTTQENETSIIFDRNNNPGILTNGIPYIFYVIASNITGNSLPGSSNTVIIFDPPDPPRNVIASMVGEGSVELNWDLPAYDGGSAIINYSVQRWIFDTSINTVVIDGSLVTISQRSLTINNLLLDTSYGFVVVANNTNRSSPGALSNTIKLFTNPNPPTNVVAVRTGETSIILTWDLPDFDGGSAIINYSVQRGIFDTSINIFVIDGSLVTISQRSLTINNLVLSNVYIFGVNANNALFGSPPTVSNIITIADPGYVGKLNVLVTNISGGYNDVILRITTQIQEGDIEYIYNNTLISNTMSFDLSMNYDITYLYISTQVISESFYIINSDLTGFQSTSPAIVNYSTIDDFKRYIIPNSLSNTDISYNIYLTQGIPFTLPNPPTNVVAVRTGETSIILTWDLPDFDGGSVIINYSVQRAIFDTSINTFVIDGSLVTISQRSLTIKNLVLSDVYIFYVNANNALFASEQTASNIITPPDPGYVGKLNVLVTNISGGYNDVILRITTQNIQIGDIEYIYNNTLISNTMSFDLSINYDITYLYISTELISDSSYIINSDLTGFQSTSPAIVNYSTIDNFKRYIIPNSLSNTDISYNIYLTQGYYGTLNIIVIPIDSGLLFSYSDISLIIKANNTSNTPLFDSVLTSEITSISINIDYSTNYLYIDRRANRNNISVNNATSGFEDTSIVMSEFVIIGTNLYEAYSIPVSLANSTISYNIYVYKDGFYGTFAITNTTPSGNNPKFMQAKLAYEDNDITSYQTISGGTTQTLTVPIGSRLPTAASLLQLKLIFESGVSGVNTSDADDLVGFNVVRSTNNSLQSENTFELDISSGFINNGVLELILDLFYKPPTGWWGTFTIYNYNNYYSTQNIYITVEADTSGTIVELNPFETLILGESIEIIVPEENRLTSPSTLIKITYQVDASGVLFAVYPNGLTYNWEISNATELYFTIDSGYIDDGTISLELVAANG